MKSTNKNDGKIYVIPTVSFPDPKTGKRLPEKGDFVTDSTFWRRRAKDGDVVAGKNEAEAQANLKKREKEDADRKAKADEKRARAATKVDTSNKPKKD